MAVEWTGDPAAFADPEWASLVDADPEATVFHTPGFLKVYWEELGAAERLDVATVHLVGHSLGGLLARALFHYFPDQRPGRIVTLGSPHEGSEAAAHLRRSAFWRYLMGRSVAELLDGVPRGWVRPAREIGSVSGTRSLGLARFVYRGLPRPNDGLLTVGESALPGAGHRALPVSHTGMLFSRRVADEVIAFLARGRFGR